LGNKYFEKADHATALNFYVKVFLLWIPIWIECLIIA
jgi:hypothetical protein